MLSSSTRHQAWEMAEKFERPRVLQISVYSLYTRCALYTLCIIAVYSLYTHVLHILVYSLYTHCILPVYSLYTPCALYTPRILAVYSLHTRCILAAYSLYTRCILACCRSVCQTCAEALLDSAHHCIEHFLRKMNIFQAFVGKQDQCIDALNRSPLGFNCLI